MQERFTVLATVPEKNQPIYVIYDNVQQTLARHPSFTRGALVRGQLKRYRLLKNAREVVRRMNVIEERRIERERDERQAAGTA